MYYAYRAMYSTNLFLFFTIMGRSLCISLLTVSSTVQIHFYGNSFWGPYMCPTWFLNLSYLVIWGARRWGIQKRREAPSGSKLFRINVFARWPASPAGVQGTADSVAHVERQGVDCYDDCDLGLSGMSRSGCLIRVCVIAEMGSVPIALPRPSFTWTLFSKPKAWCGDQSN